MSKEFIGLKCSVPMESRKQGHRWWVTIIDLSECGRYVKVAGVRGFGKSKWFALKDVQWPTLREQHAADAWLEERAAIQVRQSSKEDTTP